MHACLSDQSLSCSSQWEQKEKKEENIGLSCNILSIYEQHDNALCQKKTHFNQSEASAFLPAIQEGKINSKNRTSVAERRGKASPSGSNSVQQSKQRRLHKSILKLSGIKTLLPRNRLVSPLCNVQSSQHPPRTKHLSFSQRNWVREKLTNYRVQSLQAWWEQRCNFPFPPHPPSLS